MSATIDAARRSRQQNPIHRHKMRSQHLASTEAGPSAARDASGDGASASGTCATGATKLAPAASRAAPGPLGLPVEWEAAFDSLRARLALLRGRRIVVLINRGNRGDGVIHLGGRRLFRSLGLSWHEIHEAQAPADVAADVLVVFGAGAMCRTTHSLVPLVQRYASLVREVILLPSSFDLGCKAVRRFAGSWDERYTVFCREHRSFDALRAAAVRPRALLLAHDLAFCADLSEWARRPHAGTAGIFRRDAEAVFDRRPRDLPGTDISRGPDSEPHVLLDYVARFATVHTDRTHAAITAAMMGREVWFYRNAYFKNEAIYEHSLAQWPHAHFVGRRPFSFRQLGATLYYHYLQRNAYKLRRRFRQVRSAGRLPAGPQGPNSPTPKPRS